MKELGVHLTKVFLGVIDISLQASILALLVLGAQMLLGRHLPVRWRHALWLLVVLRLVLPELPASPFSIYQVVGPTVQLVSPPAEETTGGASLEVGEYPGQDQTDHGTALARILQMGAVAWALGLGVYATVMTGSHLRFSRRLRWSATVAPDEIRNLAHSVAEELGVRQAFAVLETDMVPIPAVFGLRHPRVLIPKGLAATLTEPELRLVLLHELAHLRRADLYYHSLLAVLQALHWFNPLLWLAFQRMHDDREMATDALVLSGERAQLRVQYGQTLLKLIERAQDQVAGPLLIGILEYPSRLRYRLKRIRSATPEGYRWSAGGLAVLCIAGALFLTRAYGTIEVPAKIEEVPWNGWGFSSPADAPPKALAPESFSLIKDAKAPRVFSGRVDCSAPYSGVEVGLVSLVGVHWVNPKAYQWEPVAADGTFSITDDVYPDAPKAIVVRGPHFAWTFLRYNFSANESGSDIVLHPLESRQIVLSVSGADGRDLPRSSFELFPAHAEYDDQGQPLRRQRLGQFKSEDKDSVAVMVPAGEVAVFAHRDGFASYYQVIDTRKADHFRFLLHPAGRMKITVLNQDGTPKKGVAIHWVNPAAPLSISASATNPSGVLSQDNLTPGTFNVSVDGFQSRQVEITAGTETEITLQEGTDQ